VPSDGGITVLPAGAAHAVPTFFVPVHHAASFPVVEFILGAAGELNRWEDADSAGPGIFGAIVLETRLSPLCSTHVFSGLTPEPAAERRPFSMQLQYSHYCLSNALRDAVRGCSLHFISPGKQSTRDTPAIIEMKMKFGQKERAKFEGSLQLRVCSAGRGCARNASRSSLQDISPPGPSGTDQTSQLLNTLQAGRHIVQSAFPAAIRAGAPSQRARAETAGKSAPHEGDNDPAVAARASALLERSTQQAGARLHERANKQRKQRKQQHLDPASLPESPTPDVLLEASIEASAAASSEAAAAAGAAASAAIPGLSKLMSPIIDGLLKPVVGIVGGVIGDVLQESFGNVLASSVDSGLTSEIISQLTHALTTGLTESVVPPLTETIADAVTHSVPPALRDAVSEQVTERLSASLTASLVQTLVQTIPAEISREVPDRLSEDLSSSLTFLLTQSVTQAVVPALTHVLHHNPAEDFYCAYCTHHKMYCDLCKRGGPEQLQRAQYYAAYYSRHYANAFSGVTSPEATGEAARPPPPPPQGATEEGQAPEP
jgi:hypothetical protein